MYGHEIGQMIVNRNPGEEASAYYRSLRYSTHRASIKEGTHAFEQLASKAKRGAKTGQRDCVIDGVEYPADIELASGAS